MNQKAKLIELSQQFQVFDQHGRPIALVQQVGQSAAKKALRLVASLDQYFTTHLEVTTPDGQPILQLTRPAQGVQEHRDRPGRRTAPRSGASSRRT